MASEIVLPVLTDGRVVLRGWRRADVPALEPACGDPQICRFTTVPSRFAIEDAYAWIERQQAHARRGTAAVMAIVPLSFKQPVGMVGLFGLDEPGSIGRFGYWLTAQWRERGLAGVATGLMADWGFGHRQLTAIHIDREPGNHASGRVAEKLGAAVTGSRVVQYDGAQVELIRHTIAQPTGLTIGQR